MPYEIFSKNMMLGQLRQSIKFVSLHGGKPTKDNEVRGSRVSIAFGEPLNGELKLKDKPAIPMHEGAFASHIAFWSGNGRLLAWGMLPKAADFEKSGAYILDAAVLDLNNDQE